MADSPISRLAELPVRPEVVWQGGLVRLPGWIGKPGETPSRAWGAVWFASTGKVHMSRPCGPEGKSFTLALDTLAEFAHDPEIGGYRPGTVEVRDPALAEHLEGVLRDAGIKVVHREDLGPFDLLMQDMKRGLAPGAPPDLMDAPGVTAERVRAFAEAAREFFVAAPWQHLNDADPIHVESPRADKRFSHAVVMGSGGQLYGLSFFESLAQYERLMRAPQPDEFLGAERRPLWSVTFGPIHELSFGDADLWEDQRLPVASDQAYPFAGGFDPPPQGAAGGKKSTKAAKGAKRTARAKGAKTPESGPGPFRRPDAKQLAFLEGLLRAIARSTEEEMDRGRWTKRVETADGETEFVLALPMLEEPAGSEVLNRGFDVERMRDRMMADIQRLVAERQFDSVEEINEFLDEHVNRPGRPPPPPPDGPRTPMEQATELVDRAYGVGGRRQLRLARRALELWPDCADAYALMARRAADPHKRLDLYAKAVAAGERALGPEFFKEYAGEFWGLLETRPYMRARAALAQTLQVLGRDAEAVAHYREMLRLNPGDNQGVRDLIPACLLKLGRDDELEEFLEVWGNDGLAVMAYARALLSFRQNGDAPPSRRALAAALKANRYVPQYLLLDEPPPPLHDIGWSPGRESEAVVCAAEFWEVWRATPGAVEWLAANRQPKKKKKP